MSPQADSGHAMDLMYTNLFTAAPMRAIFSDEATMRYWLRVEAALARAEAAAGVIPAEAAPAIEAACVIESIDLRTLRESTGLVGYPILPLVRMISAAAGEPAGGYVHWGATTQDIMDTATSLQLRDARAEISTGLDGLLNDLSDLADEHASTVMAGRTHGQHAVPITFGFKLAVYVAELGRHADRIAAAAERMDLVEFAGAAGTLASVGPGGLDVQRRLAADLDLRVPPIAWHTSRDGIAEFGSILGLISATLGKLAAEIAFLQRTEVGEVEEGYVRGRGGSSTMPQKRNPIGCEAIIGATNVVRQLVPALFSAMLHDNERATGPWHTEWIALPQMTLLTHGALVKTREVIGGLVVRPARMRENVDLTKGLIMAEAVMMGLARRVGRQRAHDVVYNASMRAFDRGASLKEELLAEPVVRDHLASGELEKLLEPESYIGSAPEFARRVRRSAGPQPT